MRAWLTQHKRIIILSIAILTVVCIVLIAIADSAVNAAARGKAFSSVEEIPAKTTALVLGTIKYQWDGQINQYYVYRLNAVEALWNAGKMEFVLISGDNGREGYNEPEQMKQDMIAFGIPEEKIFLDYAGFRTWDSVIRAREVFGQNELIIVSQEFHNQRALFIAADQGIDAVAFNAQDVPVARSPRIWLRERLARVKALWDVTINTNPRFLGEPVTIE